MAAKAVNNPDEHSTLVVLKGGEKFTLRFDFNAADELDTQYGIDIYNPQTYASFSPGKIASLIWAGQLFRAKPMNRQQLVALMETGPEAYEQYCRAVSNAIREALLKK